MVGFYMKNLDPNRRKRVECKTKKPTHLRDEWAFICFKSFLGGNLFSTIIPTGADHTAHHRHTHTARHIDVAHIELTVIENHKI